MTDLVICSLLDSYNKTNVAGVPLSKLQDSKIDIQTLALMATSPQTATNDSGLLCYQVKHQCSLAEQPDWSGQGWPSWTGRITKEPR